MKLLISDYDGTFNDSLLANNINNNVDAVNKFKEKGNMFGVATGRTYLSLKEEIKKYNIPYDFLICNNGATIFDSKDNLLYFTPIDYEAIYKTLDYFKKINVLKECKLYDVYGQETDKLYYVTEIICKIKIKNLKDLRKIKRELSFLNSISFIHFLILYEKVDKTNGIEYIRNLYKIEKDNIYTIGDEINDIDMLRKYNGHKMIISNPILLNKGINTSFSVKHLIKKIERE